MIVNCSLAGLEDGKLAVLKQSKKHLAFGSLARLQYMDYGS